MEAVPRRARQLHLDRRFRGLENRKDPAGPGGIVYGQFGQIHIYDIAAQKEHQVPIEMAADLTEVRPHFQNVAREIREARISATGVRAVFEAHGEILTAPADKGDIRNLTNSPGVTVVE